MSLIPARSWYLASVAPSLYWEISNVTQYGLIAIAARGTRAIAPLLWCVFSRASSCVSYSRKVSGGVTSPCSLLDWEQYLLCFLAPHCLQPKNVWSNWTSPCFPVCSISSQLSLCLVPGSSLINHSKEEKSTFLRHGDSHQFPKQYFWAQSWLSHMVRPV